MNKINLSIDFYSENEASIVVDNPNDDIHRYGHKLLFVCYTVRQLLNLGRNQITEVLLYNLWLHGADVFKDDFPVTLVEYKGHEKKHFEASLEYDNENALMAIKHRGFGIFGAGVNYYAPMSIFLLYKYTVQIRGGNPLLGIRTAIMDKFRHGDINAISLVHDAHTLANIDF